MISSFSIRKEKIFITLLAFFCSNFVVAQSDIQKVMTPPSPNAASLGSYGDVPISNYTGKMNLSIPFPSIITKSGYELPISISYNSGGVKVDEMPSFVGMSWVLNAGGVITRNIRGTDDFGLNGWYHNNIVIPTPASALNPNTCEDVNGTSFNSVYTCATNGTYDTEPDMYYYNFQNYSGKFYFDRDRTRIKIKDDNIKIDNVVYTNSVPAVQSYATSLNWSISDETGNEYIFNNNESEFTETSYNHFETTNLGIISGQFIPHTFSINSNYLSEIKLNNSESIYFEYEDFVQEYVVTREFSHGYIINFLDWPFLEDPDKEYFISELGISSKVDAKRIKLIIYKGYKVEFIYNEIDGSVQLAEIIYKHNEIVYKKYKLSYLNDLTKKRFFLAKLSEVDVNNENLTIDHLFEYNNPQLLPNRLSVKQDYWGYFNNNTSQNRLDPELPSNYFGIFSSNVIHGQLFYNANPNLFSNVSRLPSINLTKYGSLSKVTYPTKGYSLFEYELNHFTNYTNLSFSEGAGLRVKRIINYDNNNNNTGIKTYDYQNGQLMSIPNLYSYRAERANFLVGGTYHFLVSNSNSVVPLSTAASGSYVGYDIVKVYNYNNLDENNGYEEYSYFNVVSQLPTLTLQWNNFANFQPNIKLYPTNSIRLNEYNFTNGIIRGIKVYERNLNNYNLKYEEKYKYNITNDKSTYITKYGTKENDPTMNDCRWMYFISYYINSGNIQLVEKEKHNYENTGIRNNRNWYSYSNSGGGFLLNGENADGVYTDYNYVTTTIDPINPNYRLKIISSKKIHKGDNNISYELFDYNTKYQPTKITLKSFQNLGNAAGNVGTLENISEKTISYSNDNIEKIVHDNGDIESYLWDNDLIKPIAKCQNAELSNFAYTSFENNNSKGRFNYSNNYIESNIFRTGNKSYLLTDESMISTSIKNKGTFKLMLWVKNNTSNLSIVISTDVSGLSINTTPEIESYTNFDWSLYTYTLTKTNDLVANVSIDGNAIIDEIRIAPLNAQLTTYTYIPYYGMSSISDIRGQVATYEYNGFGKLFRIKDHEGNIMNELRYNYKQ